MCVQSLKLIVLAVFVLELVMCSPPRNVSLAKFLKPWKLQHQIPFKHIFWSSYHLPNFFWKSLTSNNSMLERKSKYLNFIRVFPFFISFFCWNETNTKFSIKEDRRKMENCKVDIFAEKLFRSYWKYRAIESGRGGCNSPRNFQRQELFLQRKIVIWFHAVGKA